LQALVEFAVIRIRYECELFAMHMEKSCWALCLMNCFQVYLKAHQDATLDTVLFHTQSSGGAWIDEANLFTSVQSEDKYMWRAFPGLSAGSARLRRSVVRISERQSGSADPRILDCGCIAHELKNCLIPAYLCDIGATSS